MADIYKNKSDQEQIVPGAGVWKAGEEKESPIEINNPNFEKVTANQTATTQPSTAQTNQTQAKEAFSQREEDK